MGRTIDKSIKHGNHLPGTERYTRPEEVKALAKFLKEGIQTRDEKIDILQDNLEVPQDGRPGEPMYKEVQELSNIRETIFGDPVEIEELGRKRLDLKKNPDLDLETGRLEIEGNEDLEELGDKKLLISGNEDVDLSDKRLDLSPEEIEALSDSKLLIEGNTDLDNLSDTKLQIEGKEIEELEDTRLDIEPTEIENLSETRLDIEEPEQKNLSETRLDISAPKQVNLSETKLKVEGKIKEPGLEKTALKIKENEVKKLSKEALKLSGIKDQKLEKEAELVPGKIEEVQELSDGALKIEDKPITKLSNEVERIDPKEIKELEDTRLDIEEKEVELSKEVLNIEEKEIKNLQKEALTIEENKVETLSNFRDELRDNKNNSLSKVIEKIDDKPVERLSEVLEKIDKKEIGSLSNTVEKIEKKADPSLSKKKETIDKKDVDSLGKEVLKIRGNEEVEPDKTRLDIREKEVTLGNHIETISPSQIDELSKYREDLNDNKDIQLENKRLEIVDKKDISLSDHTETINPSTVDELSKERLDIEGKDVELSDTRLDISPKDQELSNTRIDLQEPEEPSLSDIRLDISSEDKDLSDIRIDLQIPEDQELSDIRLDLEEKEVGLSDVLLDLLEDNGEWDKQRLESTVIDDPEYSLKKLTDIHEITGLSDIRLDISSEDVELSDVVIKEPYELDIPLSDVVVKEPTELDIPLSDVVIKEPKELDIPLSDIVVKEPTEKDVPLSDIVIKEPRELDIPLSDIVVREPSEKDVPLSDIVIKEPSELDIPLSDIVVKEPTEKDVPLSDIIIKEPKEKEVPLSEILKTIDNDNSEKPTETQFGLYSGTTAENLDWLNLNPKDIKKLSEVKKLLKDFGEWGQKIETYLISVLSGTAGQFVPESKVEAYKNIFKALPNYKTENIDHAESKSPQSLNGKNDSVETPPYKLGQFNLLGGGLSVSKYLRWIVENTVGRIPLGGSLKTRLIDETLRLLIETRDLAEKETESRPFRLPGNSILGTAAGMVSKGITLGGVLGAVGNLVSDAKMKPYNRPGGKQSTGENDPRQGKGKDEEWVSPGQIVKDNAKDQEFLTPKTGSILKQAASNLVNSLSGDPKVSDAEKRKWSDYSNSQHITTDADGLKQFGTAISQQYLLSKQSASAKTFEEFRQAAPKSARLTTPEKFTSTENRRNYTTLDSNHVWEVIIRPYVGALNGNKTWLPNIAEIDLENKSAFNVTTHYCIGWLPITGYELQHKKLTSKELQLHSGNIYFPIGMELTNELRITFADDSLKSIRRYFELAAKTSVYMSNIHETKYEGKRYDDLIMEARIDPTVVIEGRVSPAHYKNVSFLIDIFMMNPQFSTISRTQLLCVMKDFVLESQGESDASPTELAITFSVVGEWPADQLGKKDIPESPVIGARPESQSNSLLNNLGGVLSSF